MPPDAVAASPMHPLNTRTPQTKPNPAPRAPAPDVCLPPAVGSVPCPRPDLPARLRLVAANVGTRIRGDRFASIEVYVVGVDAVTLKDLLEEAAAALAGSDVPAMRGRYLEHRLRETVLVEAAGCE